MTHLVDVIIPVHDSSRPIERAVDSVLNGTEASARVIVVAHGIDPDEVTRRLAHHSQDRLLVLGFNDGIRSPAGPFNAGLRQVDAPWFTVLGSDDTLEKGAIDSWLRIAQRDGSLAVIARQRHASGRPVPTPPVRMSRTRSLDGVRDRLSYRSAPLGLFSFAAFGHLRFSEGVPVGEDLAYVTAIWFSGARLAYDRRGPAYTVHDDARERTSSIMRSIDDEFAWWRELASSTLWTHLSTLQKQAAVAKFLRIHLFGAVLNRADPQWWTARERSSLAAITTHLTAEADRIESLLSRRERDLLEATRDPAVSVDSLLRAARARRMFRRPGALVPRRLRHLFHRQGAMAVAFASWLQTRG